MDPVSAILINKALDGLTMRSIATAQNIANAGSPAYRPLRVTFEDSLRAAAGRGEGAIRSAGPALARAETNGVAMRLDLELATASETARRYGALIELLGRQMQISRIVIRGGQ